MPNTSDRWVLVTFDPVRRDVRQIKAVDKFREQLIAIGYTELHHYAVERFLPASTTLDAEKNRIIARMPEKASVLIIEVSQAARKRRLYTSNNSIDTPLTKPELLTIYL